jgi:hypothetical protein
VRTGIFLSLISLAAGCTSVTSDSRGVRIYSDSRALATVIVAAGVLSLAAEDASEQRPFPSASALFPERTPPAPELAPDRRINEQDCTRPIDLSGGNLRCR